MRDYPTFKVRLKDGGSIEVKCVAFQPYEPSAYVSEAYWEAESETEMDLFFVYVSGNVTVWVDPYRPDELEKEIEIGYVPAILRQNRKDEWFGRMVEDSDRMNIAGDYVRPRRRIQERIGIVESFAISAWSHLVCWDLKYDVKRLDQILANYGY